MKRTLLTLACLALTACHPSMPHADYGRCVRSHSETYIRPSIGVQNGLDYGGGLAMGGIAYDTQTVCDEYQYPLGDGPGYHEDVKRYEREMVEYRKDHPNE